MDNIIKKNGKTFVRPARLPGAAYPQRSLAEVTKEYRGQLKWINLKENKCPKCFKDFMDGLSSIPQEDALAGNLLAHKCGFKIRERRYSQIVNSQITAELHEKLQQEQEELL